MQPRARTLLTAWLAVVLGALVAVSGVQPAQATGPKLVGDRVSEVALLPDHAYGKIGGKVYDLGKLDNKAAAQAKFKDIQARTYNGCPLWTEGPIYAGYICLYKNTYYNAGMWGASALDYGWPWSGADGSQSGCANLSSRSYNTGGTVNNSAGSISVTGDPRTDDNSGNVNWYWVLFDWIGCNWNSDYIFMNMKTTWSDPELIWKRGQVGEKYFWHNPTSLRAVNAEVLNSH